jgi:hypothetical protein
MKQITRGQYYQLIGLRAVADHHEAQLKHIVRAAYSITGERTRSGTPTTSSTAAENSTSCSNCSRSRWSTWSRKQS